MIDKIIKEVGNIDGKSVTVTSFVPDNIVKVNFGPLDVVVVKNKDGEVTVTVDNYSSHTTLVTSLGKDNAFRRY